MCFSATASFTASVLLSAGGLITLSQTKKISEIPLASIPLIFGLQQGLEGIVWITNPTNPAYYLGMYGFLFCAYAFWPVFLPWAILTYERAPHRNPPLLAVALIGTGVGAYFLLNLVRGGISASILHHSVCYSFQPEFGYGLGLCYIFVVVLAGFLARDRFMKIFGSALVGALLLSRLIAEHSLPSVWCFFGALISSIIAYHFIVTRKNKSFLTTKKSL